MPRHHKTWEFTLVWEYSQIRNSANQIWVFPYLRIFSDLSKFSSFVAPGPGLVNYLIVSRPCSELMQPQTKIPLLPVRFLASDINIVTPKLYNKKMCTLPQLLYQRLSVRLYSYDKILNGLDKALNVFSARLVEMVLLTSTLHLPLYNLSGLSK